MCMEDIRIGRESIVNWGAIDTDGTDQVFIPPSPLRTHLLMQFLSAGSAYLKPVGMGAAFDGISVINTATDFSAPIELGVRYNGQLVTKGWVVRGSIGCRLWWVETVLIRE